MTREDLDQVYNDAVARCGRDAAVDAVESVTGSWFVTDTPDDKIAAVIAALRSAKPKPLKAKARPGVTTAARLDALAGEVYGRR